MIRLFSNVMAFNNSTETERLLQSERTSSTKSNCKTTRDSIAAGSTNTPDTNNQINYDRTASSTLIMSETETAVHLKKSRAKVVLVVIFFMISLVAFVCQTEATAYLYSPKFYFNEPYLLLYLTHGSWITLWPLQLVGISLWKMYVGNAGLRGKRAKYTRLEDESALGAVSRGEGITLNNNDYESYSINSDERNEFDTSAEHAYSSALNRETTSFARSNFTKYVTAELQTTFKISQVIYNNAKSLPMTANCLTDYEFQNINLRIFFKSPVTCYIMKMAFINTFIITFASITWYVAMIYSYSNDITAIYNCCAFFAYLFAIPLLHEKFSWLKLSSVLIAIFGVLVVVYSGGNAEKKDPNVQKQYSLFGNLLILVGSISYGYYDVFYKKYLCPPSASHQSINSQKQALYSNFIFTLTGGASSIILLALLFFLHVTGIKPVHLEFSVETWAYIILSIISNLLYSASMLVLYTLTSPVLGAVSSLTTIFLVGLFEWIFFGNTLSGLQLFGDFVVIVGFAVLSFAYWKEITEDEDCDEPRP